MHAKVLPLSFLSRGLNLSSCPLKAKHLKITESKAFVAERWVRQLYRDELHASHLVSSSNAFIAMQELPHP